MRRPLTRITGAGLLLGLALTALAACGGDTDEDPDDPPAGATQPAPSPTIAPPPQTTGPGEGWEGSVQVDFDTGEVTADGFNDLVDAESPQWAESAQSAVSVLLHLDQAEGTVDTDEEAGGDEPVVMVTISELADASVEAMRYRIELAQGDDGLYRFAAGEASWRCQPERGQQEFGTDPCT